MTVPERRHSRIPGAVDPGVLAMGFLPTQVSGLRVWFRADSLTLSNNDPISTWIDESGNGNNLGQSGSARPLFKTNIVNGLPVVRFDVSDDYMTLGTPVNPSVFTYSVVWRRNSIQDHCIFINTDVIYSYLQFGDSWLVGDSIGSNVPMDEDTFFIKTVTMGWPNTKRYTNGSLNTTAGDAEACGFAGLGISGFIPKDVDIAEIIFYDSVLSSSDLNGLHTYLGGKYGISV